MKKIEKKMIIFESTILIFLLLNVFAKNIFIGNNSFALLLIFFFLSIFLFGFEKEKMLKKEKKQIITIITFYTCSFLIMIYGLGLFTGYAKSPYSLTPISVVRNTIPVIFLLTIIELFRYNLCHKCKKKISIEILMIAIFTLLDGLMALPFYDTSDYEEILKMLTLIILPSISKNIMLTDFSSQYGYLPEILYQLITNLYIYLLPIYPNLSIYLESVITFILPFIIRYAVNSVMTIKEEKIVVQRDKSKNVLLNTISAIGVLAIILIVLLYSNLTPYWIAVVGSGSMTPTIQVGDAIIVDKTVKQHPEKLQVGDILVFKMNNAIYTHRIIKIENQNSTYLISTKGDREGQTIDNWIVKNKDIVGRVKFKIPYLGYPTVLLNKFIKENKK